MDTKAFFQFSYGVYLLTTCLEGRDNGCIINTACQVTSSPIRLSVTVNKENLTCDMIRKSGHFAVNVLTEDAHMEFIGRYGFRSGRDIHKLAGMDVFRSPEGDPLLLDSAEVGAAVGCRVLSSLDAGTHLLFVGEATQAVVTGYGRPLTYAGYHLVKKGITPPKASSFQAPAPADGGPRWRCSVCGYIWEGNTPPERCPICGQGREKFEKIG